jgi:chromosome partitioning protein
MPVIAVVNRKGGSGKSTLAAHIAAYCARNGLSVMLGDVDKQQSTRTWLRLRNTSLPAIAPWALDQKNVLRVPSGITHVVLDTPGGLHGFELARIVMFADAIIMPLCNSVFDRESAAQCHAELSVLPRVASGRCRLATVGMRIDARTNGSESLKNWSEDLGVPYLGALRETQLYVRCIERGLTVFDLPAAQGGADVAQWQPILDWLSPILHPAVAANDSAPGTRNGAASLAQSGHGHMVANSRPSHLMPQQESLIPGARLAAASSVRSPAVTRQSAAARPSVLRGADPAARTGKLLDNLPIPQFLKRSS